jgi:hypothetical protein
MFGLGDTKPDVSGVPLVGLSMGSSIPDPCAAADAQWKQFGFDIDQQISGFHGEVELDTPPPFERPPPPFERPPGLPLVGLSFGSSILDPCAAVHVQWMQFGFDIDQPISANSTCTLTFLESELLCCCRGCC